MSGVQRNNIVLFSTCKPKATIALFSIASGDVIRGFVT